jgi:hypothetical protein
MSTRIARSIVLSLGIAVLLTAVYYWLMNESRLTFKSGKTKPKSYSAQLAFQVGPSGSAAPTEPEQHQTITMLETRLKTMGWKYSLKAGSNKVFNLSVDKVADTNSVTELLSGSGYLELLEVYTLNEMRAVEGARNAPGIPLGYDEDEPVKATPFDRLFKLMRPARAYSGGGGSLSFPPYIGTALTRDTGDLRQLMEGPGLKPYWPADVRFLFGEIDGFSGSDEVVMVYAIKGQAPQLTNQHILHAEPTTSGRECQVLFKFDDYGSREWERMTTRNVHKPIAICLDGKVVFAPIVNQPIQGGSSVISFGPQTSLEYCQVISILLTSKQLSMPVQVSQAYFAPIKSPFTPAVKYALMFLLSFSVALGIQLLIIRLSKI